MISKVLSTAVSLWLRSQVERIEELKLEIIGNNRQILQGYIPKVLFYSNSAVYQGLHLRQVQLQAVNIKINLAEILKGKPLKLLEPIPVTGKVLLSATDLNASLTSSLLLDGLRDVLINLLKSQEIAPSSVNLDDYQISWQNIALLDQKIMIEGCVCDLGKAEARSDRHGKVNPLSISTSLQLANCHTLLLSPFVVAGLPELQVIQSQSLEIDLGEEVVIEHLELVWESLTCVGSLTVMP
ncbi:hypothetical protein Sta7437_0023 [Stanieria cyanosphaera PCC 7437]|uniref:DUF2993 domain-containing protein n=1 Tax=Stanieria cyanosphaera (strain ATCC 29371 / PCC 7437) TaxID=111780 RepID=K9XNJ2_STAC7|nr:DUF2993 domain-containing protein [Stanieria cyanosphaera]AFZ33649.1 hypothetical protein Sta7437_0023 [Stanieria cyanosphaera PCC 7437]